MIMVLRPCCCCFLQAHTTGCSCTISGRCWTERVPRILRGHHDPIVWYLRRERSVEILNKKKNYFLNFFHPNQLYYYLIIFDDRTRISILIQVVVRAAFVSSSTVLMVLSRKILIRWYPSVVPSELHGIYREFQWTFVIRVPFDPLIRKVNSWIICFWLSFWAFNNLNRFTTSPSLNFKDCCDFS